MNLFVIILLCFCKLFQITAVSRNEAETNCNSDSCANSRARLLNNIRERRCLCDKECTIYGDCCRDAGFGPINQNSSFHCHSFIQFGGVYVKDTCKEEWTDLSVREKCETRVTEDPDKMPFLHFSVSANEDLNSANEDPISYLPLTKRDSGITYKNYYCALCNEDLTNLEVWLPMLDCMSLKSYNDTYGNLTSNYMLHNLKYDDEEEKWGLYLTMSGKSYFFGCDINPVMPILLQNKIRLCIPVKSECDPSYEDQNIIELCHSYMSATYYSDTGYKNVHCAQCNGINQSELTCHPVESRDNNIFRTFDGNSFSMLFDINNVGNEVGLICEENQVYDMFFKRCRTLTCAPDYEFLDGKCVSEISIDGNQTEHFDFNKSIGLNSIKINKSESIIKVTDCAKIELLQEDFVILKNLTAFIPVYNLYLDYPSYMVRDGKLLLCADLLIIQKSKFTEEMGYVTMAGLGISIFSLMLHIIAFCLVPDIRNFSGKNLMSLVTALLLAYLFFITGQFTYQHKVTCKAVGITTYFFFLVSFFWMNVLAFDVWRTLRMATTELRVSSGNQWKRFILYSFYSWLLAACIVTVSVLIDNWEKVPQEFRPHFGSYYCWFGKSTALLVFFAGPVVYVMLTNAVLFILSSRMILKTTVSSTNKCNHTKRNYKLYLRLALIMGLTWIFGLAAGYLDQEVIWYVFILLNTLQGMFIFVAFTCNRKVWNGIKLKWKSFRPLVASRTSSSNSTALNSNTQTRTASTRLTNQSSGSNFKELSV